MFMYARKVSAGSERVFPNFTTRKCRSVNIFVQG